MSKEHIEYSDFLPIWKDFIKDAGSVFNVQMVAHHFYNLGRNTAPRELSDEEIDEVTRLKDVWFEQEDGSIVLSRYKFARAILKKASEK